MGMFDWYEPKPALSCPVCGKALDRWQGMDGPCGLFVWRQGESNPVEQRVDEDCRLPNEKLQELRLPRKFELYTDCCGGEFWVKATGRCRNGTWTDTELLTADRAKQEPGERRSEFRAKLKWLRGPATDGE